MAKFSSYFIEIEWWQSFHYIYQLHCIWQSLVFEVITYCLCNTWFVLWLCGGRDILGWQYDTQYELLRIYVHHGAPFCVLTVKRHCLPLMRLPCVAGGAPAVNHKARFHTYTYGFRSFRYSGSKLWNSLPRAIKNTNDINEFKKNITEWCQTCDLTKLEIF